MGSCGSTSKGRRWEGEMRKRKRSKEGKARKKERRGGARPTNKKSSRLPCGHVNIIKSTHRRLQINVYVCLTAIIRNEQFSTTNKYTNKRIETRRSHEWYTITVMHCVR